MKTPSLASADICFKKTGIVFCAFSSSRCWLSILHLLLLAIPAAVGWTSPAPSFGLRDETFDPLAFTMRCYPNYCFSDGRGGLLWSFVNLYPSTFSGANNLRVGGLVRTTSDGVVDTSFVVGPALRETMGVAVQPDGGILVGGRLVGDVAPSGAPNYRVFRLQTNGVLDASYHSPVFAGAPRFMALQPDGKLLACLANLSDAASPNGGIVDLARLNPNGSLDAEFQRPVLTGGLGGVFAPVVLDSNGYIYLGGGFTRVNGQARQGLVRLNPDGTLDQDFVPSGYNFSGHVRGLLVQPGGKVVIAGRLRLTGTTTPYYPLLRLNSNGSFDPTFNLVTANSIGFYRARILRATPDGKLLTASTSMARFNSDGTLDNSFVRLQFADAAGLNQYTECYWFEQLVDCRLVLPTDPSGGIGPVLIGGQLFNGSVCLLPDGALDTTYSPPRFQQEDFPLAAIRQPDQRLLVAGLFDRIGTNAVNRLARLNPDSTLDTSFNFIFTNLDSVAKVAPLPENQAFVSGQTWDPALYTYGKFLARIQPDGTVDDTFDSDPASSFLEQSSTSDFLLQGELPVAVAFNAQALIDQTTVPVARFQADGTRDPSFNVPIPMPGSGFFYDGTPITDWSTVSLTSIGYLMAGDIQLLTTAPGAKLLVAIGTNISDTLYNYRVLRLLTNGEPDDSFVGASFSPGRSFVNYEVITDRSGALGQVQVTTPISCLSAAVVQSNGYAIVAGSFTNVNGAFRPGIARLLPDAALDPAFPAKAGPTGTAGQAPVIISGVSLDSAGNIWVTGNFLQWDGYNAPGYVRLNSDGTVDTNCVPQVSHWGLDDYASTRFSGALPADSTECYTYGPHLAPGETWPRALSRLTRYPPPPLQPVGMLPGLGFSLSLETTYGQAYWLQTSSDLKTWENWLGFIGTGLPMTTNDSAASNSIRKFYRLRYQ